MSILENQKGFKTTYLAPLMAGAVAGMSVDVALYPLDTLKTRLQSEQGFYKAGGFRGVYKGLSAVATTSMPGTALFFVTYETTKSLVQPMVPKQYSFTAHMFAASVGEVLACIIRVPTEIAKQRKQTYVGSQMKSNISILVDAYKSEGFFKGVYRGFFSTVIRDVPFSLIEMPVWEFLKSQLKEINHGKISGIQSACCGSLAGCFAAAVTTPLDLAKTRIMLNTDYQLTRKMKIVPVLTSIYKEAGVKGLFAGLVPRSIAFMLGGFVFFGAYEHCKSLVENVFDGR